MHVDNNSNKTKTQLTDDGRDDWPQPPNYRALKLALVGIALVASCAAAVFFNWNRLMPVDHHARAMEFLAEENYASTVTELKHVIRENPADGELRWIMGDAYLQLNRNEDATDYMQDAYDLGYRSPDLVLALARSKLLARNYKAVMKLYEEWGDVESDISASAWEVLHGRALLNLGALEEAVAAFTQALRLNPYNGEAKKGLVDTGLGANLAGMSEDDIQRALSTGLEQPETWLLRGELELSRGNLEDARAAFEGAVQLGPENVYALSGLVRTLIASEQLEDAREPVALLAKKFPEDPMGAYVRALYAKQTEEYVQALDALSVVLDYEPDHAMSLLLKGEVYAAMDNPVLALEYLNLFHRRAPDSVLGRRQLAAILNDDGSHKQAIEILEPLLEQSRRDPEIAAILASAYAALGDKQRAQGYQSLFFKLGSVSSATRVALDLLNSGDTERAVSKLKQLVAYAPETVETQIMLAVALLHSEKYGRALSITTALLQDQPDDPQVLYLHGTVLELSGDPVTAREFYERALALEPRFDMADLALTRIELEGGNRDVARQHLDALLAKDAHNTAAQLWRTQMAMQDGEGKDAIPRLEKIRATNKKALQPRLLLADLYLDQGDADDALLVSQEIVKLVPNHPAGTYLLARAQVMAGDIDAGLALLHELEDTYPDNLPLKWQVIEAQEAKGDTEATYETLQRILATDQNSLRALVKLAMLERQRGDLDAAMALADQLIQNHRNSGMGYLITGQLLMDSGSYVEASEPLLRAYLINADSVSLARYYTALSRAGKFGKAKEQMTEWLAANPDDNIARLAWADEAARRGKTKSAIKLYEEVAEREPGNVPVLVRLASAYKTLGDRRDLKTAQEAYELDSDDLYAKHLYGWLLAETGLGDQGTQMLEDVVARAPDNITFRVHLAVALAENGQEDDAKTVLRPLVAADSPVSDTQLADMPQASALMEQLGIKRESSRPTTHSEASGTSDSPG